MRDVSKFLQLPWQIIVLDVCLVERYGLRVGLFKTATLCPLPSMFPSDD